MSEGAAPLPPQNLGRRLKLSLKRWLSPQTKRAVKRHSNNLLTLLRRSGLPEARSGEESIGLDLHPGDLVRIRSRKDIEATLNHWGELKGCAVMEDMWQYCGTRQRVLKPVRRFVDERDYRVKKSKGLVLLEGLMCQGLPVYGSCDRACFFFWREEWLERIGHAESSPSA